MKKIALSAMIATVATVVVFQAVLMTGGDIATAFAAAVVAFAVATFAVAAAFAAIAVKLKIPYKWVFGVYAVEMATLSGVFLFSGLATSMAIMVAGCGLIAGIWRLYNYNCQLALTIPKQ